MGNNRSQNDASIKSYQICSEVTRGEGIWTLSEFRKLGRILGECSQLAISFDRDVWNGFMSAREGCFDKVELSMLCCLLLVSIAVLLTNFTPVGIMCASFVGAHLQITVLWLFVGNLYDNAKDYCVPSTEVTLPVLLKGKLTSLPEPTRVWKLLCQILSGLRSFTRRTQEQALGKVAGGIKEPALEWVKSKLRSLRREFKDLTSA